MPRPPKLRSSCDACGAVKLKCDRGQPDCGRCLSLDLVCVYSVSRKNGKPPRKRLDIGESRLGSVACASTSTSTSTEQSPQGPTTDNGENGTSAIHPPADTFMTGLDSFDSLDTFQYNHFAPSSLLPDFGGLDFGDILDRVVDTAPLSTLDTPPLGAFTTSARTTDTSQPQDHDGFPEFLESASFFFPDNTTAPGTDKESHDCFREAHNILSCLAYHDTAHISPTSPSPSTMADIAASSQSHNTPPLDHMLRSNREAIDHLSRLIICPCGTSNLYLSLLYAAIISRVLSLYQKAATHALASTDNTTPAFCSMATDPVTSHHRTFSIASGIGSSPGSSSASNTAAPSVFSGSGNSSVTNLTTLNIPNRPCGAPQQLSPLTIAPTKISLGTFDVDDTRSQTAVKMQLISNEVRRVKRLIDQFRGDQDFQASEYAFGGRDSLYQGLDNWLRAEYARVANSVSNQLRELNTY